MKNPLIVKPVNCVLNPNKPTQIIHLSQLDSIIKNQSKLENDPDHKWLEPEWPKSEMCQTSNLKWSETKMILLLNLNDQNPKWPLKLWFRNLVMVELCVHAPHMTDEDGLNDTAKETYNLIFLSRDSLSTCVKKTQQGQWNMECNHGAAFESTYDLTMCIGSNFLFYIY